LFQSIEDKLEDGHEKKDASLENKPKAPVQAAVGAAANAGTGEAAAANAARLAEFRRIYEMAFPVIFKVAYRIAGSEEAAEDICQESFFCLYDKKMVFPSTEEAKYWLIRVVKNAALNYAKRKERERKAYQRAFREDTRKAETGEGQLVKKETIAEIQEAINKLPENLRMALVLKEYSDMNYKEIGKALGISEGNVKVRVFRARERLALLLGGGIDVS